jgi:hypothetical protein
MDCRISQWPQIKKQVILVASMIPSMAASSGSDTTVQDRFDCSSLPTILLEQSLLAGESLFEPGDAEKFGWRPWDEEFQKATGLQESEFPKKPRSSLLSYDRIIYQRTDIDQDGKGEIVVLTELLQGTRRYRINYELHLFCDKADWFKETCDGNSAGAYGSKFVRSIGRFDKIERYPVTDIAPNSTGEVPEKMVGIFDVGAVFIPIEEHPYVVVTERFYSDEARTVPVFGATIWPVEAEQFGTPKFCIWRE